MLHSLVVALQYLVAIRHSDIVVIMYIYVPTYVASQLITFLLRISN